MTRKVGVAVVVLLVFVVSLVAVFRVRRQQQVPQDGSARSVRFDDRSSSLQQTPSGTEGEVSSGDTIEMTAGEARQVMRDYARDWKADQVVGVIPQLPSLPVDVGRAVDFMKETSDQEVLTSVAIVMVKYGREVSAACGKGMPIGRRHPMVDAFIETTAADRLGDDIVTSSIVKWIEVHREGFVPSPELDAQVKAFQQEEATRLRRFEK
jgi:hypothetical protein